MSKRQSPYPTTTILFTTTFTRTIKLNLLLKFLKLTHGMASANETFFIHYYIWPLICNFSWIFSTFFCVLLRYWLALLIASNSLKVTPSKKTTIWQIVKYFPWSVLKWNHEPQASGFTAKFWTFWRHFYGQYEYRTMENCCRFVYTITLILFEGQTKTNCDTITSFSWTCTLIDRP